jgi:lipid A 3-O-deacylase
MWKIAKNQEILTLKTQVIGPVFFIALFTFASVAIGADEKWVEFGARFGFSKEVRGEDFNQLEIATAYRLPRSWMLDGGWKLESRINASGGALHRDGGGTAAIVTMGPGLAWVSPSQQYAIEAGISPTLLSKHEFGGADFGGNFQFTSFVGLNSRLGEQMSATIRVQHMSNASIYDPNPGLDQMMLGIHYRF